jgi:SAM-dependent methyltransferase
MLKEVKQTAAYVAFKERKKAVQRWLALTNYVGNAYQCPVCDAKLRKFKPMWRSYARRLQQHGFVYPIESFETFNLSSYSCPACDASDRERLFALYLDERLARIDKTRSYVLVDFAASTGLAKRLRSYPWLRYRTADLYRAGVDDRVDISNMAMYAAESIDVFICSHVLEHVPDDRRAMRELFRVLRPGGFGIVMVPLIIGVEETHEDLSISDPAARWMHYAQDDHVRLYGRRDFVARLEEAGFQVLRLGVEHFGAECFGRAGVDRNSVLYVATK